MTNYNADPIVFEISKDQHFFNKKLKATWNADTFHIHEQKIKTSEHFLGREHFSKIDRFLWIWTFFYNHDFFSKREPFYNPENNS